MTQSVKNVVIIGSGGHAKVIIDILRHDSSVSLVGTTAATRDGNDTNILGLKILGDDSILPHIYQDGIRHAFVAIGDNGLRQRLTKYAQGLGFQLINAKSPNAWLSPSVKIGVGVAIMPGAVVNADTRLGDGVILNTGSTVDHDCSVGNFCHVAPGCSVAGSVTLGEGAFLGLGTKVIDKIHIGQWSTIGAGGVVIRNIPDCCVAVGVPAKVTTRP